MDFKGRMLQKIQASSQKSNLKNKPRKFGPKTPICARLRRLSAS
jgi:hypothetical protein